MPHAHSIIYETTSSMSALLIGAVKLVQYFIHENNKKAREHT